MMKIYNSLTRQIEEFKPLEEGKVKVYCCGPTVYSYVTIGNFRTYFLSDLVIRTLKYLGYEVDFIMNITDVGHLTGDNLGDANTGEDRLEKAAKKENRTVWDIAKFYMDDFLKNYDELNLTRPREFCRATSYIEEQINLVKKIEEKGFAYRISDGIYFDTKKYEESGNKYGELSNIDEVKEGARVAKNPEKKDPRDFALWKFSYPNGRDFDSTQDNENEKRAMEWESPWGLGFPGWHAECSAMSMKHLGDQVDIHLGGEDLKSTHHPNEIAQSECATGKKPFVKYWIHGAFLQVDGGRMGKSLGNAYTLTDIKKRGYKPEHLRYFYLTGHYRQPLNFTWENLENAKRSYENLVKNDFKDLEAFKKVGDVDFYENEFKNALSKDLNTSEVLSVVWNMMKSKLSNIEKRTLLIKWDQVLGLNLEENIGKIKKELKVAEGEASGISIYSTYGSSIMPLVNEIDQRELARQNKDWEKSDKIRDELAEKGFILKDRSGKVIVERK